MYFLNMSNKYNIEEIRINENFLYCICSYKSIEENDNYVFLYIKIKNLNNFFL